MTTYVYGADYYAKALQMILARVRQFDDSREVVRDVELIADQALDGAWDDEAPREEPWGIFDEHA